MIPLTRIPLVLLALSLLSIAPACGGTALPNEPGAAPETVEQAEEAATEESYEASLRRLALSEEEETRRRAIASLAIFLREAGRLEEAADAFGQAADTNPVIAPYLRLQRAEVSRELGRPEQTIETLRSIIASHPDSPVTASARLMLPAVLASAGMADEARAAMSATRGIAIDELNDEEFAALAAALDEAGLVADASAVRLRVLTDFPRSRFTETHYRALDALPTEENPLDRLSWNDSVKLADHLGRVNRYDQALDMLVRIRERFPNQIGDPSFRHIEATALFNSRNYRQMTEIPARPGEPYYLAMELLRAHAYWRSDRAPEFREAIQKLTTAHPRTRQAGDAKILLAKYYQTDEMDLQRSARLFQEGIAIVGPGREGRNLWTLAWTWILAEEWQKALAIFDRYLKEYPDADYTSNALFWSARIQEKLGNREEHDRLLRRLIDFYPYTYYSYRAREILGDETLPANQIASGVLFPEKALEATPEPRLETARELRAVGLQRDAARELRRIAGAASSDQVLAWRLADFYADAGEPLRAISILNRTFPQVIRHGAPNVPDRFWKVLYPRAWWPEIQKAAAAAGVDPWLALAIIRQESAWEPTTVSSAGAVGLMQIMPKEAAAISTSAGLGSITRDALFEPSINVRVGTVELRQKLDLMDGNQILAIAAYNGGENAVNRWVDRTGLDDIDRFIDSISYG
ncbi:MAG: transglycosylase SLT domain-containing protein, partial [Thermoanaerobaculia bacterium]